MNRTKEQRDIIARYVHSGGTGQDSSHAEREGIILALAELIEEVRNLRAEMCQPTRVQLSADDLYSMANRSGNR